MHERFAVRVMVLLVKMVVGVSAAVVAAVLPTAACNDNAFRAASMAVLLCARVAVRDVFAIN